MKLIGLKKLKSVLIGKSCFQFTLPYMNPKRGFYMRDCPQVKELIIGHASFHMYRVCEIANNPSLEGIEVGGTSAISHCFGRARLELKSVAEGMRWRIDLLKLTSLRFGISAFHDCPHVVLERELLRKTMMYRTAWIDLHSFCEQHFHQLSLCSI